MSTNRSQAGIALIVVLWTIALLSLLAGSLGRTARIDGGSASLHARAVQARAVAESGIWATLGAIVSSDSDVPQEYAYDIGGGTAAVRVESVTARININAADPSALAALLDGTALAATEHRALVARIVDWRDADSERGDEGFEDQDYKGATLANGAKDAPFYTVDELRHVAGIDEASYRRIAPFLTVFGNEAGPDVRFASEELARALGVDRVASSEPGATVSLPRVGIMNIRAVGVVGGARADLVAVVYLTGRPLPPYEILSWHGTVPGVAEN